MKKFLALLGVSVLIIGCNEPTQEKKDREQVQRQQSQYSASQPVPTFNWSLERHLMIELYNLRNIRAVTHSVWRSDLGTIEGDCASVGFGIPYDTSLTNPLQHYSGRSAGEGSAVEQAEPNGIFASKNTAATWVMCAGENGQIAPIYVETKVTTYPYSVSVDYDKNRVIKSGETTVTISPK